MKANEKGSVTLIVLVTILFMVIILSSFLVYVSSRRRAQLKETEEISKAYDGNMEEIYSKLKAEFSTEYGRIEVVWLDVNNNIIQAPNNPANYLGGMVPVMWEGTSETETTATNSNWYNYSSIGENGDNTGSHWANAKNGQDYFVWIPRYAYRITYYESEDSNVITGYCDGRGIVDVKGEEKYPLDTNILTVTKDGKSYIVHPAFMKDDTNAYSHGGWSSNLAGVWVAKYETAHSDATLNSSGTSSTLKVVPSVKSYTSVNVGNSYTNAYNYDRSKESHLMKNSEWGAVIYLAHSQYGRNGHEICINNSSDCITGNSGGNTSSVAAAGLINGYNTDLGQKSSTTGNIYGVYDLSGGAVEFIAAFNDTDVNNQETNSGSSFAGVSNNSTKYATKYNNSTETDRGNKIYEVGKIGDASKEVYSNGKAWFKDGSIFLNSKLPFMARGGYYNDGAGGGTFYSSSAGGNALNFASFRIVLAI